VKNKFLVLVNLFFLFFLFVSFNLDFPNLPYLIDDDVKITQSKAILYYLGRKYNLMGTTPEEEARAIMLSEESYDLHIQFAMFCYGPNGDSETERKRFIETSLSDHLKKFDDYLGKNNSKFVVGNQITIADFQVYDCLDICFTLDDDNVLPKKFVNIKRYLEAFSQLPELKDFIEKSNAELPMNSASMYSIKKEIDIHLGLFLDAKFGGTVIEKK
jgi:glutathione S-transferase